MNGVIGTSYPAYTPLRVEKPAGRMPKHPPTFEEVGLGG